MLIINFTYKYKGSVSMKFINKKIVILVLFVVVITTFMFWKNINNEDKLEVVRLKNNNDTNMFAIMLEQSDGTYDESTNLNWPDGYKFNPSKSGCIDASGNDIANSLEFDTSSKKAILKTEKASYCYLYFSIPRWCNIDETAGECLLRNPTSGLNNTNIEGGMYRYQGNSNNNDIVNNYVCFGTSSKTDCFNDVTQKYMYRIIGINASNQLKLIATAKSHTGQTIAWWDDNHTENIEWPDSNIFTMLNGNDFLLSETNVPAGWESKIATTNWKYGDTSSNGNYNGETMYNIENPFGESIATDKWTKEVEAKVGLMYIHDYYYAYAAGGAPGSATNSKKSWIYSVREWTMARYIKYKEGYDAWVVDGTGNVYTNYIDGSDWARPVFYLESSVRITSGTGTQADPFMIN